MQLFSINEIWKSVQQRLIELDIMKDPDLDSLASESESSDFEEGFDFLQRAQDRVGKFMHGRKQKDSKVKGLKDLMKPNDVLLMNKMLAKVVEHELKLEENRLEFQKVGENIGQLQNWQKEIDDYQAQVQEKFEEMKEEAEANHAKFLDFKDQEFPEYMVDYRKDMVETLIKDVNKVQGELVTMEILGGELEHERNTNIRGNIDEMAAQLRTAIKAQNEETSNYFQGELDKQHVELVENRAYAQKIHKQVVQHEEHFQREEEANEEPTEAQMQAQGLTKKFGLTFDKNGNIATMSKKDVQLRLLESNVRQATLEDLIKGLTETSNSHNDQIKSFNKKLAHNKADTQIIMKKKKEEIERELEDFREEVYEIEDMITKTSARQLQDQSLRNSSVVRLSQDGFGNYSTQTGLDNNLPRKTSMKASNQMTQTIERGEKKKSTIRSAAKEKERSKRATSPTVDIAQKHHADGTDEERTPESPKEKKDTSKSQHGRSSGLLAESPSPPVVSLTVRKSEDESFDAAASKGPRHSIISRIGHSNIGGQGSDEATSQERAALLSQSTRPKRSTVRFPQLGRASMMEKTFGRARLANEARFSKNINNQNLSNRYGSQDHTAHLRYSSQGKIEVSRDLQHLH